MNIDKNPTAVGSTFPYYNLSESDKEEERWCRAEMMKIDRQAHMDKQFYVDRMVRIYNRSSINLQVSKAGVIGDIII